jgi:hypothetical protein
MNLCVNCRSHLAASATFFIQGFPYTAYTLAKGTKLKKPIWKSDRRIFKDKVQRFQRLLVQSMIAFVTGFPTRSCARRRCWRCRGGCYPSVSCVNSEAYRRLCCIYGSKWEAAGTSYSVAEACCTSLVQGAPAASHSQLFLQWALAKLDFLTFSTFC